MESPSPPTETADRSPRQFPLRALFKLTLAVAALLTVGVLSRDSQYFRALGSVWALAALAPIVAVWAIYRLRLIRPVTLAVWSVGLYGLSMCLPAIRVDVMELPDVQPGWLCFVVSFGGSVASLLGIGDIADPGIADFWAGIAYIVGAAANAAFIFGYVNLLVDLKREENLAAAHWSATLGTSLALAAIVPMGLSGGLVNIYPGHGLWVASLLALALGARGAQSKTPDQLATTSPSPNL